MNILQKLHEFATIEEMIAGLSDYDETFLRKHLHKEFDKVKYYENADEWNDAVRICEALAIIGWGDRQPVEAKISRQDKWRSTYLRSNVDDKCFREANWLPRKAGRYICNFSDYFGPSHKERKSFKSENVREEDIICRLVEALYHQRNSVAVMPIWFSGRVDTSEISWTVNDYGDELSAILKDVINPAPYICRLENFKIWLSVGWAKNAYKLGIGNYYAKRKSFSASLHYDRDMGELSLREQRLIFAKGVREAVQALTDKLRKRNLDFPGAQFEAEVDAALDIFASRKENIQHTDEQNDIKNLLVGLTKAIKEHQDKEPQPPA